MVQVKVNKNKVNETKIVKGLNVFALSKACEGATYSMYLQTYSTDKRQENTIHTHNINEHKNSYTTSVKYFIK